MNRYIRQITLPEIGEEGQRKILSARVLIAGCGGLCSPVALYLAGAGVGIIGIADDDTVTLENLHRQVIHKNKSIGRPKVDSARETILELNPEIKVVTHPIRLNKANSREIIKDYDIVVDATDNFESRYAINSACVKLKKPFVYGAILRFQGQLSVFAPHINGPCYKCVFPEPPPESVAPKGAVAGILGTMPGIIGTMQAHEVIKLITGCGEPLIGKILIFDGKTSTFKKLKLERDRTCSICELCLRDLR